MMMGLNVRRTKFQAYILDGVLCGIGGFLFCLNSCAGFVEQAKGLEMDAISAAVIGGTLLSGGVGNRSRNYLWCNDQRNHRQPDHNTGYPVKLVDTNRTFCIALLLHRTAGSVWSYEEKEKDSYKNRSEKWQYGRHATCQSQYRIGIIFRLVLRIAPIAR